MSVVVEWREGIMKHLIIIGAGNFGRELYWHAKLSVGYKNDFIIKGYIDDIYDPSLEKYKRLSAPWLGKITDYRIQEDDVFICAIGDGGGRAAAIKLIKERGGEFINLIHKTSIIQGVVGIGKGVFVGPYTVIGDHAKLGNHVMVNTHSAIGHDAIVGDYTCIMSYVDITGWSVIGEKVFLASGCRITPGTKIGDNAYIGIGSVVLRRVKSGTKVFGNPAKRIDL